MPDDDDHEHEEHEHHRAPVTTLRREATAMGDAMMESMAPMLGVANLFGEEAKAWDDYHNTYIRTWGPTPVMTPEQVGEKAIEFADKQLIARRARFNEAKILERMRPMLPHARGLCNKALIVNGKETEHRCTRNDGHTGTCY